MPTANPGFGLAAAMAVLSDEVERRSLRAVAEEIGMSPSGLHILLKGSRPHAATRRKLLEWYSEVRRRGASDRTGVPKDDVDAAVALLERYVNADARKSVQRRRVREIAERLFGDVKAQR